MMKLLDLTVHIETEGEQVSWAANTIPWTLLLTDSWSMHGLLRRCICIIYLSNNCRKEKIEHETSTHKILKLILCSIKGPIVCDHMHACSIRLSRSVDNWNYLGISILGKTMYHGLTWLRFRCGFHQHCVCYCVCDSLCLSCCHCLSHCARNRLSCSKRREERWHHIVSKKTYF